MCLNINFYASKFLCVLLLFNLPMMSKTAIIMGASGLIGSKLLSILLNAKEYDQVISIGRKKIKKHHRKFQQFVVDFDEVKSYSGIIKADVAFCCLGTTKNNTPNLTEYYKIDHDYPINVAVAAKENGVLQYHFVSSIGADATSGNFYLKTKGETERDLAEQNLNCLHIYQPSLLTGRRKNRRVVERLGAAIMWVVNPFLTGAFKKYRSIPAQKVAMAMYKQSLINKEGVFTYTSDQIQNIA